MIKDTSLTRLDCLKGKEILILMRLNLKWSFAAKLKTWDLIIDSKLSEFILSSAEAKGQIFEANEGKRMCAPVNRHL